MVIKLSTANFWQELEQLRFDIGMPVSLVDCLKELVSSHIHSMISPEATPTLINWAKRFLNDGILLSDSSSDRMYGVMVFVPNPDGEDRVLRRSFFKLVPKYPRGELKYLKDL